jgi:nitrate/nitrite transporter NarK
MMVGALGNSIIPDLGQLSDARKGLMVAVPVLGGSLQRLIIGPLADHIGALTGSMTRPLGGYLSDRFGAFAC